MTTAATRTQSNVEDHESATDLSEKQVGSMTRF